MSAADTSRPTTPLFSRFIPRSRKLSLRSTDSNAAVDRQSKRLSIISKSRGSEQQDKLVNTTTTTATAANNDINNDNIPHLERSQTPLSPNYLTDTDALTMSDGSLDYADFSVDKKRPSMTTFNRAQVIIDRLEGWEVILRETTAWLEEIIKASHQTSRQYQQRALPHVNWQQQGFHKNSAASTLLQSMRFYTSQTASIQQELGGKLQRDYMQQLNELRKECKARIVDLQQKPELQMNELLRRAELTQKSMAQLRKLCQAADSTNGQVSQDPWLTNLHVLKHLKHEVDEENRMRVYMVSVQQQITLLERRIIDALKPAVQCCYDVSGIVPSSRNSAGREAARFRRALEELDAKTEWARFIQNQKEELVTDEDKPSKDYRRIRYNFKTHPAVTTLFKGTLSRRMGGVKRQYVERFCVLTQCGYLHQFGQNDKINPEASIYIPKAVIIPSIDISHLAGGGEDGEMDNDEDGATEYTFEIRRPGVLTDKSLHFKANTRHELVTWCRLLVNVATSAQKYYLEGANRYYNRANQRRWSGVRRKPMMERNQQQQQQPVSRSVSQRTAREQGSEARKQSSSDVNEQHQQPTGTTVETTEEPQENKIEERHEADDKETSDNTVEQNISIGDKAVKDTITIADQPADGNKDKEPEKAADKNSSNDTETEPVGSKPSQLLLRMQTAASYFPLLASRSSRQQEVQEAPKPKESISNTSSVSYKSITNE